MPLFHVGDPAGRRGSMRGRLRRAGFTLVEMLVVIAILGTLVALLLPAVQKVRAAGSRTICQNNLKQLALGLLGHHDAKGRFPSGITCYGQTRGDSFFVTILPYIEQVDVFNRYQFGSSNIYYNSTNQALLKDVFVPVYRCPSSPLPQRGGICSNANISLQQADYIGIAGAINGLIPGFTETRTQTWNYGTGIISGGGVLFPSSTVKMPQITDGTASTLLVGEVSDWINKATTPVDYRSSFGWAMGYHGAWYAPTTSYSRPPPNWTNSSNNDLIYMHNLVAIRYLVNMVDGWSGSCSDGVCGGGFYGSNQPLRSTHDGGALAAFCDGSVRFMFDQTALNVLARLATRDDGTTVIDGP